MRNAIRQLFLPIFSIQTVTSSRSILMYLRNVLQCIEGWKPWARTKFCKRASRLIKISDPSRFSAYILVLIILQSVLSFLHVNVLPIYLSIMFSFHAWMSVYWVGIHNHMLWSFTFKNSQIFSTKVNIGFILVRFPY